MVELVSDILPKIGLPGIAISIVIFLVKFNPITSISSSWIELKLYTKEKRLSVGILRTVFEFVVYLISFLMITDAFFHKKSIYNTKLLVFIGIIVFAIFIWVLILDLQEKTFLDLVEGFGKKYKIIFYLIFILDFVLLLFILPSYYLGTQIYSDYYNKSSQWEGIILISILFLFIIVSMYYPVFKTFFRFLGLKNNLSNNLVVSINNKKWYIFHPVEKNLFILGDKPLLSNCSKIKYMEKKELFSNVMKIEKNGK